MTHRRDPERDHGRRVLVGAVAVIIALAATAIALIYTVIS
jgi:hypothetical protein